ncbi:hypothetical protein K8S17_02620 [bacterium]|nr:hypothetical protein [bacterium]
MTILRRIPHAEVRVTQQQRRHAQISTSTLHYMLDYGISLERRLRWQQSLLRGFAEDECDLYEAMHLSERLVRVETNVRRRGGDNELLKEELLSRTIELDDL